MNVNERIAKTRRAAGVSQGRLARRAGVSQTLVSQFEIGNILLRPEQIEHLEKSLRVELERNAAEIQRLMSGDHAVPAM